MEAIIMKLKNTAFTNNVSVWTPSINDFRSNPDWGMEVGQSEKHTFTEAGIDEILTAMVYYKIQDENEVMVGLGKGGKLQHFDDYDDKEFVLTSLFPKVYLNGKKLTGQKLLMYITKDLRRKNNKGEPNIHFERRQLKFSKNLTYQGREVNKNCIEAISNIYGQKSSWAILKMKILNEDELHLYGIKISDEERKYKNKDARNDEFEKLWKEQHPNEELNAECDATEQKDKKKVVASKQSPFSPSQIIYYGVPGSGKSHSVDVEINNRIAAYNANKDDNDKLVCAKQVIRTVFHPDYCYTDFIGQIMPKKNSAGEFKYEFKPGPFARIIRSAYLNPQKPYFLVIEEINRGNAAAIFGETFQLLDRYVTGETSKTEEVCNENYGYSEGWSRYPINNDELNEYILQGGESSVTEKEPGVEYDSDFADDPQAAIKIPSIGLHFSSYCGIRLPPNLSIYATMNTSDQNVFTLDNAFQRRWTMKQISSELENSGASADQYNQTIKRNAKDKDGKNILVDTNVKWGDFRKAINEVIMESALENGLSSMEDKRLGGWFYVKSDNFAEKVLKYLWDDAFKFSRSDHFGEIRTLEELVEKFNEQGFDVFTDTSISDLQPPKSSSSSSDEV